MNKKAFILLLPSALLQYVTLLCMAIIFFSTRNSVMQFILERIFGGNVFALITVFLIYFAVSLILAIICYIISLVKNPEPLALAKTATIIKLIQIPAYIVNFVLSILFIITIFTIGFAVVLLAVNCVCLFISGVLNILAMFIAVRKGVLKTGECILYAVFQFVFCLDIVSSVLLCRKLNKRVLSCSFNSEVL
jgi:hypothetical protein